MKNMIDTNAIKRDTKDFYKSIIEISLTQTNNLEKYEEIFDKFSNSWQRLKDDIE